MSKVTYRQAELIKASGEVDVVWIPVTFAKKGNRIRVGDDPVLWTVSEVYGGTTLTADEMNRRRKNLKRFQWVLGD